VLIPLLRTYLRAYQRPIVLVIVFQLVSTIASLYLPGLNAQIIDQKTHHDKVEIGSHIVVEAQGSKEQYVIVGSAEAAPAEGRISNESPVGKALMGHRAGETVRLVVPAGAVEMKILTVRWAPDTRRPFGPTKRCDTSHPARRTSCAIRRPRRDPCRSPA